jgi:hypothetical protein
MTRRFHRPPRRGVVLLVILSLLVLFALLGVTFVIVSGQYKRSAGVYSRAETYGDDYARQLDTAMYNVVRDTLDPQNPLHGQSLLNDIYGHDTYYGVVTTAPNIGYGGQIYEFKCTLSNAGGVAYTRTDAGYFNGCVLTFFKPMGSASNTNRLAGISTRVVGSGVDQNNLLTLRIMRPAPDNASDLSLVAGDRFLINGKAFSGTGAGFDTGSGKLDRHNATYNVEEALLINRVGENASQLANNYLLGGANEAWDACDLQNLFLSTTVPDPTTPSGIKMGTYGNGIPYYYVIPSFHRPALYQYMRQNHSSVPPSAYCMRPIPGITAGPNFPYLGNDPSGQYGPIYGPWDVDSDGDGVNDAIWLDLNMPVQTASDGRRYKPLFAFKIADLDNRINLNFHGNEQHTSPEPVAPNRFFSDLATQTAAWPVKGVGMGPGEIVLGNPNVNNAVGLIGLTQQQYNAIMFGDAGGMLLGRYGADRVAGRGTTGAPGVQGTPVNVDAANDPRGTTRWYTIPPFPSANVGVYGASYQGMSDLRGVLAGGIDPRGMHITDLPTNAKDQRAYAVYRTNMVNDRRFTPHEMERILRYYDLDIAQLPGRMEALTGVLSGGSGLAAYNRQIVTYDSRDIPVASASPTASLLGQQGNKQGYRDPMELLRRRLGSSMLSEQQLLSFVDKDFYFGLKMDLNRPFGDAVDGSGNAQTSNYIVDEQDASEVANFNINTSANVVNGEDFNGDGQITALDQMFVRQQFAKHLYILASLCVDTGATPNAQVQQQLAQWAVNVVDFRDSDSIMTFFEYDPNPFDGWDSSCDGVPNGEVINHTTYGRVWGCERPELLITETLATHQRRTTDEDMEDPVDMNSGDGQTMKGKTTGMAPAKDGDYDQKYLPEGSGFIEIYNPWNTQSDRPPAEFYYRWNGMNAGWQPGVVLDQTTPNGGSPVWRILVVKDKGRGIDPDELDPNAQTGQIQNADKERVIYFTDPGNAPTESGVGKVYFPSTAIGPLMPGRYAVIGSGEESGTGNPPTYTTYFGGFRNGATLESQLPDDLKETRHIELQPSNSNYANTNQVRIIANNSTTSPEPNYGTPDIQPTLAVVLNRTTGGTFARFSFSEPPNGYTFPGTSMVGGTATDGSGLRIISPIVDTPVDKQLEGGKLMKDGTHQYHREIHLQRLANPLQPYDQNSNPYLTVDSTGVDLTVFNGVTAGTEPGANGGPNASAFDTLQRGDPPQNTTPRLLWKRLTQQNLTAMAEADTTHNWPYKLEHTLGYLNLSYGQRFTGNGNGYSMGDPQVQPGNPAMQTFPWFKFNNRPFNNVYELMDVPATKSSLLTRDYTIPQGALTNPYQQQQNNYEFGHLLNFYYDPPTPPQTPQISGLYRIFDYLRIPSKYVEADTMLNAQQFTGGLLADNPFHPPFNWLSNFRDPGTVNINTIYSPHVWNALLGGDPSNPSNAIYALGPSFDKVVASRRGYGTTTDIFERDQNTPTEFANPFRPAGSGNMGGNIAVMDYSSSPIKATLLRPDMDQNAGGLPLLMNATGTSQGTQNATFNNATRHSGLRHQTIGRLSNMVTTRSNVYAVWVTIGYFEVDSQGLGMEIGAETGEVKRHRAFYMIDRSIPVGFEPGENHNVDRAILVRRYIE